VKGYLVEALLVWRREGSDGSFEKDHINEWNAMIRDRSDIAFHLENDSYNFLVHRMPPRFEYLTKADGQFAHDFALAASQIKPPPTVIREKDHE
jgi:hypothetical protein